MYLLLLAYCKGYNSETAKGRRCTEQGVGGVSMLSLGAPPSQHGHVLTNREALQTPLLSGVVFGGAIMKLLKPHCLGVSYGGP